MKYYTVYDNKTEAVIAYGTAHECAKKMAIKRESFYYSYSRQKTGRVKKGKYHIVEDSFSSELD